MDFARQQRDPKKHLIGLTVVVLLHLIIIYGLMTGLARKAVEVIKKPISATVVEEIKKPPPPPPPPPPKKIEIAKPPPIQQPYVPPPDIPPPPQVVEAPVITTTPEPPKQEYVIAPPPPPAPPVEPPKPAFQAAAVVCPSQEKPSYPREAIRANVEKGEVTATLSIDAQGNVTNVEINNATPPRVFDRVVKDVLGSWKCQGQGQPIKAKAIITFRLTD